MLDDEGIVRRWVTSWLNGDDIDDDAILPCGAITIFSHLASSAPRSLSAAPTGWAILSRLVGQQAREKGELADRAFSLY